jgi:Peptidase family M28
MAALPLMRRLVGGYSEGETPLPIPNREVKPLSADGTWRATAWESRSPPAFRFRRSESSRETRGHGPRPVTRAANKSAGGHSKADAQPAARVSEPAKESGVEPDDEPVVQPANELGVQPSAEPGAQAALDLIRLLAEEIGPRRPCSAEEARAGREVVSWLEERGVDAHLEEFKGYASFGYPYGLAFAASLAGALAQRRGRRAGDVLAAATLAVLTLEDDLRVTPLSRMLSRKPSANVVASIPAAGEERQRVCLTAHRDSTRSGLMFHPRIARALPQLLQIPAISSALAALGPFLRRSRQGRRLHTFAIGGLVFALAMLAERELRGADVPGASDNASGTGVVAQLAAEYAAAPLQHTRVDLLVTGCEESGLLGVQAYLRARSAEVQRTTFVNFDTVGGDVPLTYILREGTPLSRPATPRLVQLAQELARRRPDLGLVPANRTAGLPTDATAALARGCEAITFLAQGKTIPHYHWPSDTVENIAPRTVERTLTVGRELLAELDRLASFSPR